MQVFSYTVYVVWLNYRIKTVIGSVSFFFLNVSYTLVAQFIS